MNEINTDKVSKNQLIIELLVNTDERERHINIRRQTIKSIIGLKNKEW